MGKKIICVIGAMVLMIGGIQAQEEVVPEEKDVELWQAFSIDFKLAKNVKAYIERQLRYNQNLTAMKTHFTEVGIRYKLSQTIRFRLNYRLISGRDEICHRVDGNVYLNLNLKGFELSNRARLQQEFISYQDSELLFRNRLRLIFGGSGRVLPYVGTELFVGISESAKRQNQFRISGGITIKVKKKIELGLFYHYEKDMVDLLDKQTHIVGGKFNYSI